MKAIRFEAIVGSLSSRVDGGLGMRMSTPELTAEEKAAFFGMQNQIVEVLLYPKGDKDADVVQVKKQTDGKSPSQRLHAVLFILWKQEGEPGQFDSWYISEMERVINGYKARLPQA